MASEKEARKAAMDDTQRQELMAFPEGSELVALAAMGFLGELSSRTCLFNTIQGGLLKGPRPRAARERRELPLTESPPCKAFSYSLYGSESS